MEITEVRIKLTEESDDRLQAFCSVTFDDAFVVRDLKIIEGTNGPFVAMPSRKLTTHCGRCRSKNHIRANYCNQCGAKMSGEQGSRDHSSRDHSSRDHSSRDHSSRDHSSRDHSSRDHSSRDHSSRDHSSRDHSSQDQGGRAKLYADIAHPINSACREMIQNRVVDEYRKERDLSQRPDYVSRYEDDYDDAFVGSDFDDISVGSDDKPSPAKIDIQPSQTELPPPHSSSDAGAPRQETPHSGSQVKRKGFGAGILDE